MLYWALVFFILAIVAGAMGFGGLSVTFGAIAKILFFVFLIVFVLMLISGVTQRRRLV